MPLIFIAIMLLLGFVEFKLISSVYTFIATRYDGLSAVFLILLSFFLALSLGLRLIRGVSKTRKPLHLLAGILFILPGYLSDIFALLVLLPTTSWILNRLGAAWMQKLFKNMNFQAVYHSSTSPGAGPHTRAAPSDPTIIDVEAYDTSKKLN